MWMPDIPPSLVRNLLLRNVGTEVVRQNFRPGEIVEGKILQVFAGHQKFILRTKGLNLMARSRLTLRPGDRIKGKVIRSREEIEIKLVEVNGAPVHRGTLFTEGDIQFVRVPLPESFFGPDAFLQVYPDAEDKQHRNRGSAEGTNVHLILETPRLKKMVLDVRRIASKIAARVWVEHDGLLQYLISKRRDLRAWICQGDIHEAELDFLPLNRDVAFFRREWLSEKNLDVRV